MNPKELQKIFQTVQKNIRCPHCGKQYAFENIHLMSFSGSVYFLQLECESHMPMLASVAVDGKRIESTNYTGKITADDVIAAHEIITKAKSLTDIIGK